MPRVLVETPVSIPAFDDLPLPSCSDCHGNGECICDDERGESLDAILSTAKSKPKRKASGTSPSKIDRAFKEFDALFRGEVWKREPSKIRPEHAVAFYARLHVKVYSTKDKETGKTVEVYPEELRDGKTWLYACAAVKRLIEGDKREFDDGTKLFEFILWTWQKERDRVEWLRKKDTPIHKRITWRDQFVLRYKLTDYRQAMAEEKERGKRR